MAVAQLKKDLGLLNDKCGSNSTKHWPCKRDSPAAAPGPNKTKVDSELLPALVSLTQASPNLQQTLKEFAKTWHCNLHNDKDIRVSARVELWLASFPSGKMAAVAPPASAGGNNKTPRYAEQHSERHERLFLLQVHTQIRGITDEETAKALHTNIVGTFETMMGLEIKDYLGESSSWHSISA